MCCQRSLLGSGCDLLTWIDPCQTQRHIDSSLLWAVGFSKGVLSNLQHPHTAPSRSYKDIPNCWEQFMQPGLEAVNYSWPSWAPTAQSCDELKKFPFLLNSLRAGAALHFLGLWSLGLLEAERAESLTDFWQYLILKEARFIHVFFLNLRWRCCCALIPY